MNKVNEDKNSSIPSSGTAAKAPTVALSAFTPGPWEISESKVPGYSRHISVVAEGRLSICDVSGAGSYNPQALKSVRANACLIAAAPTLYKALRALLDELDWRMKDKETTTELDLTITELEAAKQACNALALAEGRVPERETETLTAGEIVAGRPK